MTDPAASPLRSAGWLLEYLNAPGLVLLDCRFQLTQPGAGEAAYSAGHIPGAVYAHLEHDLSGPKRPGGEGGRHPLPGPQALADWLGSVGVRHDSTVLAYDDPSGGHGFYAARAWWLLRWLGLQRVSVLGGGVPAYLAAGGELTTEVPSPAPAVFVPEVQAGWVADAADVQARSAETLLVDSRAAPRYRGDAEPIDPRAGHILGAINRDWAGSQDASGHWRSGPEQAARLGLGEAPAILYCGSGVSAAANLLALAEAGRLPGPHTRLYAGSWSDWVSGPERPAELGGEAVQD